MRKPGRRSAETRRGGKCPPRGCSAGLQRIRSQGGTIYGARKRLRGPGRAAVVVSGSNDVNVQTIVNAINNAIDAYGSVIEWSTTLNYRQGVDKDITDLIDQMNGGQVGALMIYGANPVYNYY